MTSKFIAMAAAVVASASAAGAADLGKPVKAAVDYVKVCDTYGAGFFYIPGSDTCLKIGGRLYMDERVGGGTLSRESATNSVYADKTRTGNPYYTRAAAYFNLDTRTNTEFGLLRSYEELRLRYSTGSTATEVDLTTGFIQWGGLLAGKSRSAFDFTPAGYSLGMDYGMFQTNTLVNQLAYTFSFGNGVTGTVGIIDATSADNVYNNNLRNEITGWDANKAAVNGYGGNRMPDVVANLNVTQAWGSAQISAALHDDYSVATTVGAPVNVNGSKIGYALNAGVEFKLDQIAKGDKVAFEVGYSSGALGYITALNTGSGNIGTVFNGGKPAASTANNYIGQDWAVDATGGIRLTNAWGAVASFHHEFNPKVEWNFDATYLAVDGYQARDLQAYGLMTDIRWKPTGDSKFYIALGVEYGGITFSNATKAANPAPALANASGWEAAIRVNRSF